MECMISKDAEPYSFNQTNGIKVLNIKTETLKRTMDKILEHFNEKVHGIADGFIEHRFITQQQFILPETDKQRDEERLIFPKASAEEEEEDSFESIVSNTIINIDNEDDIIDIGGSPLQFLQQETFRTFIHGRPTGMISYNESSCLSNTFGEDMTQEKGSSFILEHLGYNEICNP